MNKFIKNRKKYLEFCCHINFENFNSHQLISSEILYFYENFNKIKRKYNKMFGQQNKKIMIKNLMYFIENHYGCRENNDD